MEIAASGPKRSLEAVIIIDYSGEFREKKST
jgi:hypothetical protein